MTLAEAGCAKNNSLARHIWSVLGLNWALVPTLAIPKHIHEMVTNTDVYESDSIKTVLHKV